jgi:hypothetical protein
MEVAEVMAAAAVAIWTWPLSLSSREICLSLIEAGVEPADVGVTEAVETAEVEELVELEAAVK